MTWSGRMFAGLWLVAAGCTGAGPSGNPQQAPLTREALERRLGEFQRELDLMLERDYTPRSKSAELTTLTNDNKRRLVDLQVQADGLREELDGLGTAIAGLTASLDSFEESLGQVEERLALTEQDLDSAVQDSRMIREEVNELLGDLIAFRDSLDDMFEERRELLRGELERIETLLDEEDSSAESGASEKARESDGNANGGQSGP